MSYVTLNERARLLNKVFADRTSFENRCIIPIRTSRFGQKGYFMNADTFLRDREIERFRRLACAALSGTERTRLLGLMADEEDRPYELTLRHLNSRRPLPDTDSRATLRRP